mmetsp:Transcript_23825/g.33434  ORF Transcript_23825/g.33434 Transcript_23825/m.33434 type:complete len:656 (+) Transcript_23825:45-2012(+)
MKFNNNVDTGRISFVMWLLISTIFTTTCEAHWIDPDTPEFVRTTTSFVDGSTYELVMSDEFNVPNRTFKDGHDSIWTALDRSDNDFSAGGGSLHYYNSSTVTTEDGHLKIKTSAEDTSWSRYDVTNKKWLRETRHYKTGMVQSWNKFCFTGGIVEIDVMFPGEASIGGLWPAMWMLGNLGRATYEASTNNIWPWSYNKCNKTLQAKQKISACDNAHHFGLNKHQGRGATEIDIIEVMAGDSNGPLDGPKPSIQLPYGDMTLQLAPGVENRRPQFGHLPVPPDTWDESHTILYPYETWYENLTTHGSTSLNPFFYGTYLDESKPGEPATRTKKEAFQADAIGAVHQLTKENFEQMHTFRLEWQPGPGGRIDWYTKRGVDWTHAFSIKDESLASLMGSQIPAEPSYFIMNTAISSTWGFPYAVPKWCQKCYNCNDPKCKCAMNEGFCEMLKSGKGVMSIDYVRLYQSKDPSAHVGENHTLGCDPPEYPTKSYILGHEEMYMLPSDRKSLLKVQKGGAACVTNKECGGLDINETKTTAQTQQKSPERGACVPRNELRATILSLQNWTDTAKVCKCNEGYTGPFCLSIDHVDDFPSAWKEWTNNSPFKRVEPFQPGTGLAITFCVIAVLFLITVIGNVASTLNERERTFKQMNGYRTFD